MINFETEFQQYVETALWSSNDESDEAGGQPLDANYGVEDIAAAALDSMREDLASLLNDPDLQYALEFWQLELGDGQVGHDFWLTRNGHGAGFWDRFSNGQGATYGRLLTNASKPYGTSDLYIGDDGLIYSS